MKLIEINDSIYNNSEVKKSERLLNICKASLQMYDETKQCCPWVGYLAKLQDNYVGTCAFKDNPHNNRVEIAYFTFPENEGKGYATQMTEELLLIAKEHIPDIEIYAQTLMEKGASTRILEKFGFKFIGTVSHTEDGNVWEWGLIE